MGATQSTRKLSINNDSSIQVSEAAMKRMTEGGSQPSQAPQNTAPVMREYRSKYDYSAEDESWRKRINSLKKAHDAISQKMESEYDKAVAETGQMFKRTQSACITGKLPPCQEAKAEVIKCYNENATQPLLCSKYVTDFSDCVSKKRSEVMANGA